MHLKRCLEVQVRNASQRKDIRAAEKASAESEKARVDFIIAAMSTIQGRAWFYQLLVSCSLFADPYTGEALLDNFVKGQRNIGLSIYNDIVSHCPDQFVVMMKEASIQEALYERRTESESESDGTSDAEYAGGPD